MKKLIYFILSALLVPSESTAQLIEVGQGVGLSVFSPLCRTKDYSVYEIIYLSSDINSSGVISKFAFERADGTNTDPYDSVSIYMKHTTLTQMSASTFSDTGYTLVYSGSFPNDSGTGWREVMLDNPFAYNGTQNLMVLTVKQFQASIANTPVAPRWYYTNITPDPDRARRYYDDFPITSSTPLTTIEYSANARLDFGTVGVREIRKEQLQFFPNPASENVTVTITIKGISKIKLIDQIGKIVYEKEVLSNNDRLTDVIDVKNFHPGIYLITIHNEAKIFSGRIIIE